jgi:hypothetical protein
MRRSLRTTSRSGTLSVLALAMTAALLLGTTSAKATPRGTNGLISYRVYFDPDHSTGALFVANPDGSHQTHKSPMPYSGILAR